MSPRDPSEERAERAAETGAAKAFRDQLRLLGIDTNDQDSLNSLRDDLRYLHVLRLESEARRTDTFKTLRASLIGGIVAAGLAWVSGILKIGHTP